MHRTTYEFASTPANALTLGALQPGDVFRFADQDVDSKHLWQVRASGRLINLENPYFEITVIAAFGHQQPVILYSRVAVHL